ncbi:D-2-hydroxyacid dehydrogenase family protein [Thioclava nitratireducens]|uniref:D-2-hydroxyacid dehydrogenase family protein n=1 Tax=Thioclava nitratireducens TaxID=1915078 RepID=UPI00247FFD5F|nr:D-2-hydroxyacid dehydrogenase family protein [Thioclava nitratireducens]WGT52589.1 D-2-hydroxyacid dehydrogenase family protein [Thioclava nitratireducens]
MKVHILDDWFDTLRGLPSFKRLDGHEVTVWTDHESDVDRLAERHADAEVLVLFRERTPITAELLAKLPKLRLIAQRSSYPHVDVAACTRHGVVLCSDMAEGKPSVAAAELTLALMLAAARDLPRQMESLKSGHWQAGVGLSLTGRQLGLIGYGRIGQLVAKYARALDMNVWWWGSEQGRARAEADGEVVAPSREAFFAQSDVVSLHVRLNAATRGMITTQDLAMMPKHGIFVNTSRAGLVAPGALEAALEGDSPGRIAIDVFDHEPFHDTGSVLLTDPRVIATPHIGFVTQDELEHQFADIYAQVNAFDAGAPINVINPEAVS